MGKEKKLNISKGRRLIVICSFTAILLMVATYAWFIGMKTVQVTSFEVEIASTDSLLISLDGRKWDSEVSISKDTLNDVSYANHTNSWGGAGLVPISTVGNMDSSVSRMKLYDKTSLTPTPGGYRIMANRIDNTGEQESHGYVAFDLFIKNLTGNYYIPETNILDEEAIFLTGDSSVTVLDDDLKGTGIENSVRVAFAQIGRVSGFTTNVNKIINITCNPDKDGNPSYKNDITGICRKAQIWEPNDTAHVQNAINWYKASCLKRTAPDLTLKTSYSGSCNEVKNGEYYPTYAIGSNISSADRVDVYDGVEYNTYPASSLVEKISYYTDTKKLKTGIAREEIFSLAPNSITKVRVYVYIEGQDIDNYDFAAIGKKVIINFGFTKERFNATDIDYEGPDLSPAYDQVKPVITLNGDSTVTVAKDAEYTDAGATASDNLEGNITYKLIVSNPVDTAVPGTYTVTYNVRDWAGNYAEQKTRTVIVTE